MSNNTISRTIDRQTALCLACSSSLPPIKLRPSASNESPGYFRTRCCSRPICPRCISSNPRLARYDPCLACLGGVGVVATRGQVKREESVRNVDGAVRDEDTYVIGDDEDSDNDLADGTEDLPSSKPPPPYSSSPPSQPLTPSPERMPDVTELSNRESVASPVPEENTPSPPKYFIKPGDTLQGIALRFGVNGRELCRINNLPPSTLSTTPHILHTRAALTLPPSIKGGTYFSGTAEGNDSEREARRTRERAEKRLQTLTKEVDWRVAKAYVALADDPDEALDHRAKLKETDTVKSGASASNLEEMVVDRYLDDDEWEANERREGRAVAIRPFPFVNGGHGLGGGASSKAWWWQRKK